MQTEPSDREIVITHTFAAPRATVFGAMTQPDHLPHWLGATGFKLVACEVDLRAGGTLRYVFERPNGRRIEVRGEYDRVDAPRGYSYLETYDFSPLQIRVAVQFEEAGGATVFRQTMLYASKKERDEDYEGVVTSSAEAHARLDRYLAELAGPPQ